MGVYRLEPAVKINLETEEFFFVVISMISLNSLIYYSVSLSVLA